MYTSIDIKNKKFLLGHAKYWRRGFIMNIIFIGKKSFWRAAFFCCSFICNLVLYCNIRIPHALLTKQITDSQLQLYANKQQTKPGQGQVVLFRHNNGWAFGVMAKQAVDGCYDILRLSDGAIIHQVVCSSIKKLSPIWSHIFQPDINLETMRNLLDARNAYYRTHGAPDGHGMILPAHSRIAVLGNFNGYYSSLQSHLARLYKQGMLDEQFHLKPHCYIIALGDYEGEGCEGITILCTLLKLQELNQQQVFLLRGDQEDAAKAQINGFQKEWYGSFGRTQKDFCLAELVWLKVLMLWKSLPRVLMAGLQMPSTQHYDFLMFCHATCDFTWRPETFMSHIVEKHIDQWYKSPCMLDYRNERDDNNGFIQGTFADDKDIEKGCAKKTAAEGKETVWSPSVFKQFVERFCSRKDKKRMYEYCLCALVRAHDCIPGGLVIAKKDKNGHMRWKPLKENKTYEIEPCSVYTCTSGAQCMAKAGCFDGAFGLIEAGSNGHWYITAHLEE
jgi:hypothetical protein